MFLLKIILSFIILSTHLLKTDGRSNFLLTDTISPCFTILNGTNRVGCRSEEDGNNGILIFINEEKEIFDIEDIVSVRNVMDNKFIPVIDLKYVTKSFINKLISSSVINGVIFYTKDISSFPFSEDSECPNREYSYYENDIKDGCNWNSNSALLRDGFRFLDWNKPVFLISNQTEIDILAKAYQKFNFPYKNVRENGSPLALLNLKMAIENIKSSKICNLLSKSYFTKFWGYQAQDTCSNFENVNVFASIPFYDDNVKDVETFILSTRMDSFSSFYNTTFGDTSVLTSVITNIVVAEALGQKLEILEKHLKERKKQILFAFFHGESLGYIGSSRFIYDIKQKDLLPNKNIRKMELKDISMYVETNMILPYDENFYTNHMQKIFYDKNVLEKHSSKINTYADIYKKIMREEGFEVKNTGPSPKIPPSSYYSFLKEDSTTPGFVILPAEVSYYNTKVNTISDTTIRSNLILRDKTIQTLKAVSKALLGVVLKFSEASSLQTTIKINETYVSTLVDCFYYSQNKLCPYFDEVLRTDMYDYSTLFTHINPSIGVDDVSNIRIVIENILRREVSVHTPYAVTKNNCSEKDIEKNDPYSYSWQFSHEIGNYHCFKTSVFTTRAISPAFDVEGYDFTSSQYSTWVESSWKVPTIELYLEYGKIYDLFLAFSSIIIFSVSLSISYLMSKLLLKKNQENISNEAVSTTTNQAITRRVNL
uniref:Nicastrin n=1 Tax=Parastrongyloides trichosuri TaxID=131310 RepID=A0A0N4Z9D2_PARTI